MMFQIGKIAKSSNTSFSKTISSINKNPIPEPLPRKGRRRPLKIM